MLDIDRIKKSITQPVTSPLHVRLSEAFIEQITDGTLIPGEALLAERMVHEALGVSRATVRQALRTLIQAGLIQAVPGAGNFVLERRKIKDTLGASSAVRRVGVLVDSSRFYVYFANFASAFSQQMREAGYSIDLAIYNGEENQFNENLKSLLCTSPSALVIHPPSSFSILPILDRLVGEGQQLICVGRDVHHPILDYVGVDNHQVGSLAGQHLLLLGHESIFFVVENFQSSSVFDRAEGFVNAMLAAGVQPRIQILKSWSADAPESLAQWINPQMGLQPLLMDILQRRVTAAFCFNDELALLLEQQLRNLNLMVPRDFSLVGVDNLPFFGSLNAPLTTVALPGEEVGRQAAVLLLKRIAGDQLPQQRLFIPPKLVQRLSSAPPSPVSLRYSSPS